MRSQRLGQANQLLQANPLMPAGLDPGALASAIVAQNAALNDFNAAKAGINTNLSQSAGQVGAAMAAGQHSSNMAILNALPGVVGGFSKLFQPTPTTSTVPDLGFDASKLNLPGIVTPTPNIPSSVSVGPLGT